MSRPDPELPLLVSLEGALLRTDLLHEWLLQLIRSNFLYLFLIPLWLPGGRSRLMREVLRRVQVPPDELPFNREFLAYLREQQLAGRDLTLVTGFGSAATRVNARLGFLFNRVLAGDDAGRQLERIRQLHGTGGFAWAGHSADDAPVWREAQQVLLVNCPEAIAGKLEEEVGAVLHFDRNGGKVHSLWRALRPHQWLKNGLILLPLILSHQLDEPLLLAQVLIGFLSFCLCTSSVYLLNDLLDLTSDRLHRTKKNRAFAGGELPLVWGFVAAPLLLLAAFMVSLLLPTGFLLTLLAYWLLTCCYSLYLKRLLMVDVGVLALLLTLRVVAGAAAIPLPVTDWLLAFSFLLFLGLAMMKRVTELAALPVAGREVIAGRAYQRGHRSMLSISGTLAGLLAVAVFAAYINDAETIRLYSQPLVLWLICPLLLALLARIRSLAMSGRMDEDPVLFAMTDQPGQLIIVLCIILMWLAV